SLMHLIREELERTPLRRLGAALSRGAFRAIKRRIDPSEYGGAPLLGVKGCCVIGHGRSNPTAIKHGIRTAAEFFRSGVDAGIEAVLKRHGRIDHLINNAGVTRDNLLLRMKREEWDGVIATNLTGVFHCTQSALKPMLKQRGGRIVNVTSVVGITGNAGQ